MKEKIVVVIPAYNEAKYIEKVVKRAKAVADEVVVVDDRSKDNTEAVARKAGAIVVRLLANMGAGFSTRIGCDLALKRGADIIATIDADGQHEPEDIPKMLSILKKEDLDIIFGSRQRDKNMPIIKRIGNWGLSTLTKMLFNININDSQTGFHVFTKKAYPRLRWDSSRYGVVSEFVVKVAKSNLRFIEVPIKTIYTDKKTGMNKKDALKSAVKMVKWRLEK
ncbi:glycosyltransferase family 2 protein [Candidatus Woesearchaeota archaeon]|nr:glycosyltransferase family 2 protein [Candidatus Woesearchaeota archaeon]